jgi:hypothetical protein
MVNMPLLETAARLGLRPKTPLHWPGLRMLPFAVAPLVNLKLI